MAGAAVVAGGLGWLVHRWWGSTRWTDVHALWLAGGALIAHTAFGAVAVVWEPLDRAGLVAIGLLTIWLLLMLLRRVAARSGSV